jgi:hypothetical protein
MRRFTVLLLCAPLSCIGAGDAPDSAPAPDARAPDAAVLADAAVPADAVRADAAVPADAVRADAAVPDAAMSLRPWSGPTARLRLIDLQGLGPSVATKVCVYGADGDPRPYAVLVDVSRAPADRTVVPAWYATVPAGIPLRAAPHSHFSVDGSGYEDTPGDCKPWLAQPVRGGAPLDAGAYYTGVRTIPGIADECDSMRGVEHCDFFPRHDLDGPGLLWCAGHGLFVVRDGKTRAGYRVVNATSNTSTIGASVELNTHLLLEHLSLDPSSYDHAYSEPAATSRLQICPYHLQACSAAGLDIVAGLIANVECSEGDPAWTIASIITSSLTTRERVTTFYVAGSVQSLSAGGAGLAGDGPMIVPAMDPLAPL